MMTYLFNILQDGFFAAIAAIGFASIKLTSIVPSLRL